MTKPPPPPGEGWGEGPILADYAMPLLPPVYRSSTDQYALSRNAFHDWYRS